MKKLVTSPVFMAIFAVIAAGLIAVYVYLYQATTARNTSAIAVPDVQIGGPFKLVNHEGKEVSDKDFIGKFPLVYFGYSYCPDVCPTDLAIIGEAMLEMEDQDADLAEKILPVFVTVDPERDKPQVMKDYVANFHERMVGLTGDLQAITDAAKAYRVYFAKGDPDEDGDYLMSHSAYTYLMGKDGKFMTMFKHDSRPDQMARDVLNLVEDAS